MAVYNKQSNIIYNMFVLAFCCITMLIVSVDSAIFSIKNKHSQRPKLYSVGLDVTYDSFLNGKKIDQDLQSESLGVVVGAGDRFRSSNNLKSNVNSMTQTAPDWYHRSKRNPTLSHAEIIKERVVLNGTEKSTQAFIHWVGKGTSERIFVLTCKIDYKNRISLVEHSQLWRSDDYGSSFKVMSFGPDTRISYMYPFPTDSSKLIFTDVMAKKIYTTDDELNTNKSYTVDVEPDIIVPHPVDPSKFLLYSLTQRKLYVSINFGVNVTLLAEDVMPNFFWAETDKIADIVHMEIKGGMPAQSLYKSCVVPSCSSSEVYAELSEVGPFITGSLTVQREFIFVQKSNWNGSENYLAVSYQRQKFKRAYFPGDVKTNDFILLNLDAGQVFLAVNHGDFVNLYLSDVTGQYFTLSLENVSHTIRLNWFEVDFYEVEGMKWTFLVNKQISTKSGMKSKTYISYDKGGNWAPLVVNQTCKNAEECGLQLQFMQAGFLNSIYSESNAVGVIIAHGFTGNSSLELPSVFTSTNGGANWIQATIDKKPLNGIFRFNLMDQGGILTAISDGLLSGSNSTTVYYSLDQGYTWQSEQFDKENLIVKGVLTEPGITTMVESVFGHEMKEKPWTLIKLNFSQLLPKKCEDKDYIDWIPKDYNSVNTSCLLGSVVHYRRRNSSALCYSGGTSGTTKENKSCVCTQEDYECDFGFEKVGDTCNKSKWWNDYYLPSECEVNDTYHETNGYRKIPTDSCVESGISSKYERKVKPCPVIAPLRLSIISEAVNVQAGMEVTFHLEQAGGSTRETNYTWNFNDSSPSKEDIGFNNASMKKHIFHKSGHYMVSVTAVNVKGNTTAVAHVHVQEPIANAYIVAPWACVVKMQVTFSIVVASHARLVDSNSDHMHYIWRFGDEPINSLPTLTWNSTLSHAYNTSGLYKLTLEAVNAISSLYKEVVIQIFDKAKILILKFSENVSMYNLSQPLIGQLFTQRIRQQLAEDVGVNMNRLEAVLVSVDPVLVHLYIFQSNEDSEFNMTQIKTFVLDKISQGVLGVNILGRTYDTDNIIQIVSATELTTDEDNPSPNSGMNLKALFIAAPILVLAVIVSGVSFMYCRKKMSSLRQYNLLNNHDDTDAMLDDDEAPLDLNADFGIRESSRDDHLLESSGGSHLVMVTGNSSDHSVNC
ncbi:VPS10 domain-containing receptor SorCS1-like [Biomphalaria glabrata]|uniref:VPS10 domain-containing receptor SorCS1-like n=1 Tax=Biomphalaria glabrata TaxID=6526 RepID=A0A9U8E5X0_BIOGL|nr:VPS10 domain-containing receptor SorCS1-like [Biomphalaria glabrata]